MEWNIYIDMIRNTKFRHYFILYSSIFISSFIISTIIGLEYTNLSGITISALKNYTNLGDGSFDMVHIFTNNFLISISFLYCICEINKNKLKEFVGKFYFLKMGMIIGLVISKVIITYNPVLALSMIVPHGIIEIPTVIFAFSSGWALSELKEKRQSKVTKELIYISAIIFVLLSISAYIEVYMTPRIFETLLSYY